MLVLILLELLSIFGRKKFIINLTKVDYKISTMVAFCPCGLLSGVGIFSGLLSGGLMSGGLLSVHRNHRLSCSQQMQRTMSSMLRSGKDQNNERSESNSNLWHNFPLNYSQVLQVVSTFRAGSTVPTSAV